MLIFMVSEAFSHPLTIKIENFCWSALYDLGPWTISEALVAAKRTNEIQRTRW